MMTYLLSSGRSQHAKGFKLKQAFQVALLLAISIWLLYQIKHSEGEEKVYGGSTENKLSGLGRKGRVGWSNTSGESGSVYVNPIKEMEKKEDAGAGADKSDTNPTENAEAEYAGHKNKNVATHEGKKDDKNAKKEYIPHTNEALKENYEDKAEIAAQHGAIVNISIPGQSETADGIHTFHDETGVPQDIIDESMHTDSSDDQRSSIRQANISSSKGQSRNAKSTQLEMENDESEEGIIAVYAENENNGTVEVSSNDIRADDGTYSESSEAFNINHASGRAKERDTDF